MNFNFNEYKIICVTGKMASGKNYMTSILEEKGFISIDADLVAHKAIEECKNQIINCFLPIAQKQNINILLENGQINRRSLGKLLFSKKEYLLKQEEILYPFITKWINTFIMENQDKKIIINASNLYKIPSLMNKCQLICYIKTSFVKRLIRAKKRDKLPLIQILKRLYAQKNLLKEYKKTKIPIKFIKN